MPSELGDGEGEEWSEEPSEELEDLRGQIKENYEESAQDEGDHPIDKEDEARVDGAGQQDQPRPEEMTDVVESSAARSDEAEGLGQEGIESGSEPHESDSIDDRNEELEKLRARINERYEETESKENRGTANPNQNEEETPEPEPVHEDPVLESPQEEGLQTEQSSQGPETPEERSEEIVSPESTAETPPTDSSSQREEQGGEKPELPEHADRIGDQISPDSEPTVDDAEKIEREEAQAKVDADAASIAEVERTPSEAVREEAGNGNTPSNGGLEAENPENSGPNLDNEPVEEWESEQSPSTLDKDAEMIETVKLEGLAEQDSADSPSRQNEEVRGLDDSIKPRKETPPSVQDRTEIVQENYNEEKQLVPDSPSLKGDIGSESGINSKEQRELPEPALGQIRKGENAVSKGALDLASSQHQEVSQDLVNQSATSSANPTEVVKPVVVVDGSNIQQNAVTESNRMDALTAPPDPEQPTDSSRGKPSLEKVRPKPAEVFDSRSEIPPKVASTNEDGSTKGRLSEGKNVPEDARQKVEQKLAATGDPPPEETLKVISPIGTVSLEQLQPTGRRAPEPPSTETGQADLRGIGKEQEESKVSEYTPNKVTEPIKVKGDTKFENSEKDRQKLAEGEMDRAIEQPRQLSVVFGGNLEGAVYTLVPKNIFQELTGTQLEKGKTYNIHFSVAGVGESWTRYTETEYQTTKQLVRLNFSKANADRPRIGEVYKITIDYVTDKHRHRVADSRDGPVIRIMKSYLATTEFSDSGSFRGKKPVVEIGVKNLSKQESRVDKCYTTLRLDRPDPKYDVCTLQVRGLGAETGDVIEVQYTKRHTLGEFVENFNSHKPENLENVALGLNQEKVVMKVDGKDFSLQNPRLSTFKLQVCLKAELERTGKIVRFWSDGERTRVNFIQAWPVRKMNATDSGVDISYRLDRRHTATFRFGIDKFDIARFQDGLKPVSVPEYADDSYVFKASPKFQELVRFRLEAARSPHELRYEKGDISEEIQRHLLSTLGQWKELEYHPYDKVWRTHESKKKGPDSVQRSNASGELSYFEFRWSRDTYQAFYKCRDQALDDLKRWPTYKDEPVKSAHIGILEWDPRKSSLNFYVRKATPTSRGYSLPSGS